MLKIGISTKARWQKWRSGGAVDIATIDTCCISHAHDIERYLHSVMRQTGFTAFINDGMDKIAILGNGGAGHTECQLMVWDDHWGEIPANRYDYARAYGLPLTDELRGAIQLYTPAWHPIEKFNEMVRERVTERRDCVDCDQYGFVLDATTARPTSRCDHSGTDAAAREVLQATLESRPA